MLEVADIFRQAGPGYRARFGTRMLPSHHRAMRDIERCRTAWFGGHRHECDGCGEARYSYHSCGNRHCPKCQGDQAQRWTDTLRDRMLSCPYFLLTYTLPSELRALASAHQKIVYGTLLRSAAHALLKLAADPRYLGAQPGIVAVLHTWTRDLRYHPHAHLLVTAGGLSADGEQWLEPRHRRFLVSTRALSVIFRAKVRDALEAAGLTEEVPHKAWRHKWVVHCEHVGDGQRALDYVGRYVFRVALTNSRLEQFDGAEVTFRYRDRRSGELRRCTTTSDDFIGRFLRHVLPRRFTKVRHYGLMSAALKGRLSKARALLGDSPSSRPVADAVSPGGPITTWACPACHVGRMRIVAVLPRARRLREAYHARGPP